MLTGILFVGGGFLIGSIFLYVLHRRKNKKFLPKDYISSILVGIIVSIVMGIISFPVGYGIKPKYNTKTEIVKILTLDEDSTNQGNYFLGIGEFKGRTKYVFYYEEDGERKMKMINYEKVVVHHENSTPYYEEITRFHKNLFSYKKKETIIKRNIIIPKEAIKNIEIQK